MDMNAAFCSAPHGVIIFGMINQTLNIELPETERLSIWPWLVALVAGVGLLVSLVQQINRIPNQLQYTTEQFVRNAGHGDLSIKTRGRDISISGTARDQQRLNNLIANVEQIEGVRSVSSSVNVIDPVKEKATAKQTFLTSLSLVNTASVAFEPGSSSFTSSSDRALDQLARLMASYPDTRLRIEGHTDNTGSEAANLRLSRERARAVASYLLARGISENRLIAKGYGSTQPIDDNSTDAGRARNRRIEISYLD